MEVLRKEFQNHDISLRSTNSISLLERINRTELCDYPRPGGGLWGVSPYKDCPLESVVRSLKAKIGVVIPDANMAILSASASNIPLGLEVIQNGVTVFIHGKERKCFGYDGNDNPFSTLAIELNGLEPRVGQNVEFFGAHRSFREYAALTKNPLPTIDSSNQGNLDINFGYPEGGRNYRALTEFQHLDKEYIRYLN